MNRPSPLIRTRRMEFGLRTAPVLQEPKDESSKLMRDVREFLVGWLGGLVFFGTFLA